MKAGERTSAGPQAVVQRVAVIGAGAAGRGFALACLQVGVDVILEDVMPSNLRRAEAEFTDLSAQSRLSLVSTVEDAVRSADLAVDFVPDELESKLEIFSLIDRMAPPATILCTPSEAVSITDLSSCTYRPNQCLAVRGILGSPATPRGLRLLYPAKVDSGVLQAVVYFFRRLGHAVTVETDPDVPLLIRNAPMSK